MYGKTTELAAAWMKEATEKGTARKSALKDTEIISISPTMICRSGAGYYLGTWCLSASIFDKEVGFYPEPYDRETHYFPSLEAAEEYFANRGN